MCHWRPQTVYQRFFEPQGTTSFLRLESGQRPRKRHRVVGDFFLSESSTQSSSHPTTRYHQLLPTPPSTGDWTATRHWCTFFYCRVIASNSAYSVLIRYFISSISPLLPYLANLLLLPSYPSSESTSHLPLHPTIT